jgi:hypothetical protein
MSSGSRSGCPRPSPAPCRPAGSSRWNGSGGGRWRRRSGAQLAAMTSARRRTGARNAGRLWPPSGGNRGRQERDLRGRGRICPRRERPLAEGAMFPPARPAACGGSRRPPEIKVTGTVILSPRALALKTVDHLHKWVSAEIMVRVAFIFPRGNNGSRHRDAACVPVFLKRASLKLLTSQLLFTFPFVLTPPPFQPHGAPC